MGYTCTTNRHIKTFDFTQHSGRVFFTTDLHGHYHLLHDKMRDVGFDTTKDVLIVGGDMCDRGPDSRYVLDYLDSPWLHCVRANHEQMFIEAYEAGWCGNAAHMLVMNGGEWVMSEGNSMLEAIYKVFKELPLGIELILPNEKIGVVHAQCPYNDWDKFKAMSGSELEYDAEATAQWARTNYDRKHTLAVKGVDRLFVGHTPTESGEVEVLGNTWYTDLGSFFRDKISFIQLV